MIIKTYSTSCVNGTYDPYIIFNTFKKYYPDIEYYNPFNKSFIGSQNAIEIYPLDGIRLNKFFSGIILSGLQNIRDELKLEINLEIFFERTILFEYVFETKSYKDFLELSQMKENDFNEATINVKVGDKINEISVAGIINELMMGKLFNLNDPKLKGLLENLDYTDEKFSEKYKKDLKNVTGIDPDICGKGGGLTFNGDFSGEYVILENENNFSLDDSWKKISLKNDIYYSDILSTYVLFDKNIFNEFLRDIKNKLIIKNIISGYNITINRWFDVLNGESKKLIDNLDNTNNIYWKNLRLQVEKWQLQFLSQHTNRSSSLSQLVGLTNFATIDKLTKKEWNKGIEKGKNRMIININEIKYSLENIATPGHTHDEQVLQIETEKTNERILLLSFLAMSIPMLGAIVSPDFSANTKLLATFILLSLPISYFSVFRLSKWRKLKLDQKRELTRNKEHFMLRLEECNKELDELKENTELPEDARDGAIKLTESNILIVTNMIIKIDKKL